MSLQSQIDRFANSGQQWQTGQNSTIFRHMSLSSRSVVAVVSDELCLFEFGVAAELFGLARPELGVQWYDFDVVSAKQGAKTALGGVNLNIREDLDCLATADMIIFPGWNPRCDPPSQILMDALIAAHQRGARLVSFCSGAFALAASGLLDGQAATTHWRYVDEFREQFPAVKLHPDVLYVDTGSIMSSAGSAEGTDLGLHIIRLDYGAEIANEVARRMVVPAHRDAGQAQLVEQPVSCQQDLSVSQTIDWALTHLQSALSVTSMADHARMSERTFSRRFTDATGTTPGRWLVTNRVRLARDLLETTSLSIEQVATQSGLGSAPNLRHHFQRELFTTPTRYRKNIP